MSKESPMTAAQAKKLHARLDAAEKEIKDLKRERDAALKKAAKAPATKETPREETSEEEKPKKTFLSRLLGD